nr:molybdopterin-dependent oxidoreductase [Halomonas icarae]
MVALLLAFPTATWSTDTPFLPPRDDVLLEVAGDIALTNLGDEAHLDAQMLNALPRERLTTHTSVTDGRQTFEGFLVRDLLDALAADGETVTALALNDYRVEIPIEDFRRYDVLLADTMNEQRLTRRDKGPLWIVYPRDDHLELQDIRYDYRWVWQLHRLEID